MPSPAQLDAAMCRQAPGSALYRPVASTARRGGCRCRYSRFVRLASDNRWPLYRRDALRRRQFGRFCPFGCSAQMRRWGALNVFAERSDAFDEEAEEIGYVLPPMPHWRGTRRDTTPVSQRIGEPRPHRTGQGILIARFNIDAIRSFALLQRVSQESNTGLVHIARELTIRNRSMTWVTVRADRSGVPFGPNHLGLTLSDTPSPCSPHVGLASCLSALCRARLAIRRSSCANCR